MKFKHDIEAQAGFKDKDGQLGAAGQILSSTGSQTDWITQGDIVAGNADRALSLTMTVKNSTGTTIPTGSVVCFDNSVATPSGNVITVKLADNNGTDSMPAVGVTNGAIADGAEGIAIMFGKASGFNTSSFSTGDALYVSDTPGAFTTTKPTDVKYIQRIGIVVKVHASNGTIEVFGAGRVNDVPTPLYIDHANQRLGIGTTSPASKLQVNTGTDINAQIGLDSFGSFKLGDISNNYTGRGIYYDGTAGSEDLDILTNTFNIAGGSGEGIKVVSSTDVQLSSPTGVVITINGTSSNVGIGTTSPSTKLQVSGAISSLSSIENGTAQISILNSNTATPSEQFYVGNNLGDVDLGNKRGA